MKLETKEKLLEEYGELNFPKKTTAIKYWYQYKSVNINLFFDAFDPDNPNLSIILVYGKNYYYTSLNINSTTISKEYLVEVPTKILGQILDENNMLDAFFESVEKHIVSEKPKYINYKNDTIFTNTLKYYKNRKDLPFILGIRKVPMSNRMFNTLSETMSID